MAHFAKIENGLVTQVIVAEADFIATGALGDPASWVQTSYNTRGGIHYGQDNQPSGREPLHKNYAGIGFTWDGTGFAAPQPYPSWTMNSDSYLWEAPVAMPTSGGPYSWNESTQSWDAVPEVVAQ
jgi:hypothetical protein